MTRIKPAHSMLVALAALFVALGSGAYAASQIRTKDIKDEAVTGKKLAKGAVKSNKTKDGGLKGKDLKDETVTSEKLILVEQMQILDVIADGSSDEFDAQCPPGTRVINGEGGINAARPPAGVSVTSSSSVENVGIEAWRVIVRNDSGGNQPVFVRALCLK